MPSRASLFTAALVATTACGGIVRGSDSESADRLATRLAMGESFACALNANGGVKCLGDGIGGELGNGSTSDSPLPSQVMGLAGGATGVAAGGGAACAITATGGVVCWGSNCVFSTNGGTLCLDSGGALATPSPAPMPAAQGPTPVAAFASGVSAVGVGGASVCALRSNGTVECLGYLDNEGTVYPPGALPNLNDATALSVGPTSACAITAGGGVLCWGAGALAFDTTTASAIPVPITGLTSRVKAVGVGYDFACALTAEGAVLCWGDNDSGQLGNNSATSSVVAVQVSGLTRGVTALAVRSYDPVACAATQVGDLACWGAGRLVPRPFPGPASAVTALAMGGFICALTADGTIDCWGGVCASPSESPLCSTTPIPVPGF